MPDHDWARLATESLRRGDPAALAEVYDRLAAGVCASVVRATRLSTDFAMDCVHDTMLTLAAKPPRCGSEGELRAWMRTVAINHARTRLVSEVRRSRREAAVAEASDSTSAPVAPVAALEQHAQAREALALAQSALSREEFAVVDLVLWRGFTRRDAAGIVGKSLATVDRAMARALSIIRGSAG